MTANHTPTNALTDVAAAAAAITDVTTTWTDGTGHRRPLLGRPAHLVRDELAAANAARHQVGMPKWSAQLLEATAAAYASTTRTALRSALVDTAALAVAWLNAIDQDNATIQAATPEPPDQSTDPRVLLHALTTATLRTRDTQHALTAARRAGVTADLEAALEANRAARHAQTAALAAAIDHTGQTDQPPQTASG